MFKIYPIQKTEATHDGYEVKVNGKKVDLDTARVSAIPYNRRWPGYQRKPDQSELINFLSMATDEPLHFEITPKTPFEKVVIRPLSLGIVPTITSDGKIQFTLAKPAYCTVEPHGRNNALHLFVDKIVDYTLFRKEEKVMYFGAGEHDVGQIELQSGQTLFLDEGAVVYACVKAIDCENIKIVGNGILDNSKNKEVILYEASAEENTMAVNNVVRQHTIQIEYCKNVEIDGITIRDSLVYNIRPIACENLQIRNVKIIGCWRYNSDGIDMHNCENVLIENCFIRTFDDSICVKGFDCYYDGDMEEAVYNAMHRKGKTYDVFKNVRVHGCVIWNDWGRCLEIGAETRGREISDIRFENCDVIHVMHNVLEVQNVDDAEVFDVHFKNINVELDDSIPLPSYQYHEKDVYAPTETEYLPNICSAYVTFHEEYSSKGKRGRNRDITFENIAVFGRAQENRKLTFDFRGYDKQSGNANVIIKKMTLNGKPIAKEEYALFVDEYSKNIKVED